MSPDTLATLRKELVDHDVLSVYIRAEEHDPTERSSWRIRLKGALDEQERTVPPEQLGAFAAARAAIEAELRRYTGFLPARGWALFATAGGVRHAAPEAIPLPDLVRWQASPVLGPLVRTLRQERPVIVVLIDSLRARLFEYRNGELQEQVDRRADAYIDDLTDRTMSKRAATSSGVRGATATDTADRILRVELERHAQRVADDVLGRPGEKLVIVGGPTTAARELSRLLLPALGERLHVDETLQLSATAAQLRAPVEAAASLVTERIQLAAVRHLLDAAAPGAAVALGVADAERASANGQIERLYLTARALPQAETLIGATLDHGGSVELLSSAAAELVDPQAGGVAARLRYAARAPVNTEESALTQRV